MWPDPPAALTGSPHAVRRDEAWEVFGAPVEGGCLMILDHASAHVPDDIDLGVRFDPRADHEGVDIGVREVAAEVLLRLPASWAVLGGVSRLVIDCNRDLASHGLIPTVSDDLDVAGNAALDAAGRAERVDRFYTPYHDHIARNIAAWRPSLILSIHSFTPSLATGPAELRPWDVGILYNEDARLAPLAIDWFTRMGLNVGDQLPYSGRLLNHTMNVHAEANGIPYVGVEIRQDHLSWPGGWIRFGEYLAGLAVECRKNLAQVAARSQ